MDRGLVPPAAPLLTAALPRAQFVNFHQIMTQHSKAPEPAFALAALMEIPQQCDAAAPRPLLACAATSSRCVAYAGPVPPGLRPFGGWGSWEGEGRKVVSEIAQL